MSKLLSANDAYRRLQVVDAIRDYQYYRDALGEDDELLNELPHDAARSIEEADRLVETICGALEIKRYEL